jgi:hypothetical protein
MDLQAAEQLNGRIWCLAKVGAFLFFLLACGMLLASLLLLAPAHSNRPLGSRFASTTAIIDAATGLERISLKHKHISQE